MLKNRTNFYKFKGYLMTVDEFKKTMAEVEYIPAGSELHQAFHAFSQEALKITAELNNAYHTPDFPPFHTDCGKNTKIGKRVFINAGCQFQDQGGITIGDDVLVGPQTIIATLNHDPDPEKRGGMIPKSVKICDKVWLGARVTVCPGVTIGEGAIVGAGAVVTKDVPPRTVVAGVPAKVVRQC